ncbi:MAG: hypothetical protein HC841_08950 [Verrucomicrobiae bacterium]|nr:hypothetical protein [Verrucomicrobiae bacterium]
MNFRDEQARNLRASLLLTVAFFAVLLGFGALLDGLFFGFKPLTAEHIAMAPEYREI